MIYIIIIRIFLAGESNITNSNQIHLIVIQNYYGLIFAYQQLLYNISINKDLLHFQVLFSNVNFSTQLEC